MSIPIEPTRESGESQFKIADNCTPKHWDILITKPDGSLAAEREHGKDWNIPDAEYAFKALFESIEKIRIECSKYCYESDKAKQELDKAEAENVKLREALTNLYKEIRSRFAIDDVTAFESMSIDLAKPMIEARKLLETKP